MGKRNFLHVVSFDPALKQSAQELYQIMTDPTLSCNQLKRPTTRTCLHCGKQRRSQVSILCESPFCSDECAVQFALRPLQASDS